MVYSVLPRFQRESKRNWSKYRNFYELKPYKTLCLDHILLKCQSYRHSRANFYVFFRSLTFLYFILQKLMHTMCALRDNGTTHWHVIWSVLFIIFAACCTLFWNVSHFDTFLMTRHFIFSFHFITPPHWLMISCQCYVCVRTEWYLRVIFLFAFLVYTNKFIARMNAAVCKYRNSK